MMTVITKTIVTIFLGLLGSVENMENTTPAMVNTGVDEVKSIMANINVNASCKFDQNHA